MTRDEVRAILRAIGACGETDANISNGCLLPPEHPGPCGWEANIKTSIKLLDPPDYSGYGVVGPQPPRPAHITLTCTTCKAELSYRVEGLLADWSNVETTESKKFERLHTPCAPSPQLQWRRITT